MRDGPGRAPPEGTALDGSLEVASSACRCVTRTHFKREGMYPRTSESSPRRSLSQLSSKNSRGLSRSFRALCAFYDVLMTDL